MCGPCWSPFVCEHGWVDNEARLRTATRRHYESNPFVQVGRRRIDLWDARLRKLLPGGRVSGRRVLDVGCGSGEVAAALRQRGADVTCVDLTERAARRAHELGRGGAVVGDALHLPMATGMFDEVISIGVLHHTPNCQRGIQECLRVTKPNGYVTILLYRRYTAYHLAYVAAAPLRSRVDPDRLEALPRWLFALLRLCLRFTTGLEYDDAQIRAIIADQLWTPQATFHRPREVELLARSLGATIVQHDRAFGYSDTYQLKAHSRSVPVPSGASAI